MQIPSRFTPLFLGIILYAPTQFCMQDHKVNPLIIDPHTMSTQDLTAMKNIQTKHPFLFSLLTCAHCSPEEAEKAMAKEKERSSEDAGFGRAYIDIDKMICWGPNQLPQCLRPFAHYIHDGYRVEVETQKVAAALQGQGAGCKRFSELIIAQQAEYAAELNKKAADEAARCEQRKQEERKKLLADLGFPQK